VAIGTNSDDEGVAAESNDGAVDGAFLRERLPAESAESDALALDEFFSCDHSFGRLRTNFGLVGSGFGSGFGSGAGGADGFGCAIGSVPRNDA